MARKWIRIPDVGRYSQGALVLTYQATRECGYHRRSEELPPRRVEIAENDCRKDVLRVAQEWSEIEQTEVSIYAQVSGRRPVVVDVVEATF